MSKFKKNIVTISLLVVSLLVSSTIPAATAESAVGVDNESVGLTEVTMGSLVPMITETGEISLSMDACGSNTGTAIIQVDKPAGATVVSAYMAAASTGFTGYQITNTDIQVDGNPIVWDLETPSSISSYNYWADVTSVIKPIVDAAPTGLVDLTVTEVNTYSIDGEILAVIFEDPAMAGITNTVVLFFGAQDVNGDTFDIVYGTPLDTTDPDLVLDFSLGISYGAQYDSVVNQYSQVDVNGERMTTSAGGQDDGVNPAENGALITVGGIGDTNDNPVDPYAMPNLTDLERSDDELYSLLPFVEDGDTATTVYSYNPSNDDNIFYCALFAGDIIAYVGEQYTVSKDWRYTNVCFELDNDGDGRIGEDPVNFEIDGVTPIDDDGDGLYNEDPWECGEDGVDAYVGDLLPQDVDDAYLLEAVLKKSGTVSSYNPGQFYAVSTVEVLEPLEELNIIEDYFNVVAAGIGDLNPPKGGGKVVVVKMMDGIPVQIYNAMDADIVTFACGTATVSLTDVDPGTYMVYVKFAPPKHADWTDDYSAYEAINYNSAYDGIDSPVVTAEAMIRVIEKVK